MISPDLISSLALKHQPVFDELRRLEAALQADFYGMQEPVTALVLAVAARETLLFIGPPGTAKSMLIRRLCFYLGMPGVEREQKDLGKGQKRRYFEYLLTAFTEPGELFGFLQLKEDRSIKRNTDNMILGAEIVYLDEVFNASSAILNSLLAFLNEGRFHDRGEVLPVAEGQLLFGASNRIPRTDELKAVYDRFMIRCEVNNLRFRDGKTFGDLGPLMETGFRTSYGKPESLELTVLKDGLPRLRGALDAALVQADATTCQPFLDELGKLIHTARNLGMGEFSNRRLIRMLRIMILHRMLRVGKEKKAPLEAEELGLIPRYFLDRFDHPEHVAQLRERAKNSLF